MLRLIYKYQYVGMANITDTIADQYGFLLFVRRSTIGCATRLASLLVLKLGLLAQFHLVGSPLSLLVFDAHHSYYSDEHDSGGAANNQNYNIKSKLLCTSRLVQVM